MEDKMDTSTEYMKVRTRGGTSPNGLLMCDKEVVEV